MDRKQHFKACTLNTAGVLALFALLALLIHFDVLSRYHQGILVLAGINIILTVSLNLATGFLGQLALGHAGFMSVGAYTAAIFTKAFPDIPELPRLLIGLLLGALLAGIFGLIVGIPALRLKGDYLAIITLGFGEIIRVVIENISITGGAQGLRGIKKLSTPYVVFWVTVIIVALLYCLIRSRHGRAIMAIREDEIAAESSGINLTYYRTFAFTISAMLAGVAGGLYAHHISILGASNFGFMRSVEIVVMVVLGGMGSFTGSILSAATLTILPEALRSFSTYRMLIYSIALVAMMIFKPSGLLGTYEFSLTRVLQKAGRLFSGKKAQEAKAPVPEAAASGKEGKA